MKRIFTLLMFVLLCTLNTNAQTIYYLEDFENGMPADYKTYDLDGLTPAAYPQFKGLGWIAIGGIAASTSYYSPSGAANDWMVTKGISIPAASNPDNRVQLVWFEQTTDASYPDGYEVYVSETGQAVADFETKLLTVTPTQAAATAATGTLRTIDLSAYAGKTVYFAFRNNTFDGTVLIIDNITVVELGRYDMAAESVTNKIYNKSGNITIKGRWSNYGWDQVKNFNFNYTVDGGAVTTANVGSATINPLDTKEYSASIPWASTAVGKHEIAIWPTNINGQSDGEVLGDTSYLTVYVYDTDAEVTRNTLLETYTSSSCPPCKPGNEKIASVLNGVNVQPLQVKFQQDFPGTGDPYCTAETVARRGYYSINAIPDTRIDGDFLALNPNGLVAKNVTDAQNRAGLVNYDTKYKISADSQSITVFGTWSPTVDMMLGNVFHFAISEKQTNKNKTSNGETVFYHVVKKMYPSLEGTNVDDISAGDVVSFEFTYTFPGKYRLPANGQAANVINLATEHSVENFNNLEVVMWIENTRDQYILNSGLAQFTTASNEISSIQKFVVYPNPSNEFANVSINLNEALNGQLIVTDMAGRELWSAAQTLSAGNNTIELPIVSSLAAGTYNVTFKSGYKVASQELIVK